MRLALILLVACGSSPPHPIANTTPAPAPELARTQIFRRLTVGKLPYPARRQTFVLTLDPDRATLVETDEKADRDLSMEDADRYTAWQPEASRTYDGPVTRDAQGWLLELSSAGVQPLRMHCTIRTVEVAGARAVRVRSPDLPPDYECGDRGVWQPAATTKQRALVCLPPELTPDDDPDGDAVFTFAAAPGLEWAFRNDDCVVQGGGLRAIAPR